MYFKNVFYLELTSNVFSLLLIKKNGSFVMELMRNGKKAFNCQLHKYLLKNDRAVEFFIVQNLHVAVFFYKTSDVYRKICLEEFFRYMTFKQGN